MTAPRVTVTWGPLSAPETRKPTIWEALAAKLGREPTHREACADVARILSDGLEVSATQGRLRHQRGRR